MKIGEFSKKYNVPISTIRYYIEEGLITPKKNGAQYNFGELNEFEMQLLTDLRESAFSLEEMRQFVNISRIFDEKDPLRYKELKTLFEDKKDRLSKQIEAAKATIKTIDLKLNALTSKEAVLVASNNAPAAASRSNGLPLRFLTYLACPDCGGSLDMDNVKMSADTISSGRLHCSCGYTGHIEDGILFADEDTDLDFDPCFCDDYFIDLTTPEHEPIFYECFLSAPQQYLSLNYEARTWLNEAISAHIPRHDVILFPDIASVFPYLYSNAEYIQNSTLVIMSLSRNAVTAIRKHINALETNLNIIYIVSSSNRLPLKKKCIDLMIDYLGSYNYAFFFDKPLYQYIDPYFSDTASIAGCLSYYDDGAKSACNITKEYKNAMKPFITLRSYMDVLHSCGYSIVADKKVGSNTVFSEYFHYHEYGEKQHLHTFLAARSSH